MSKELKTEELKPCPKCQGKANVDHSIRSDYRVICSECGIQTKGYVYRDDAVIAWNTRADLTPHKVTAKTCFECINKETKCEFGGSHQLGVCPDYEIDPASIKPASAWIEITDKTMPKEKILVWCLVRNIHNNLVPKIRQRVAKSWYDDNGNSTMDMCQEEERVEYYQPIELPSQGGEE